MQVIDLKPSRWSFVWDEIEKERIHPYYEIECITDWGEVRVVNPLARNDFHQGVVITPEVSYQAFMRGICTNYNAVWSWSIDPIQIYEALLLLMENRVMYSRLQHFTDESKRLGKDRLAYEVNLTKRLVMPNILRK